MLEVRQSMNATDSTDRLSSLSLTLSPFELVGLDGFLGKISEALDWILVV